MKKLIYRYRIFLRSFSVTAFMLLCIGVALTACGYVYTVVEHNAFGREVSAFSVVSKDYVMFFGKEFYFPVISVFETIADLIRQYSSGIIKLLGFAVISTKELINQLIELI